MAADVNFEVVRFALSTAASGTQDVTVSGFGTPKAAIFILTRATSDDHYAGHFATSIGWTDGTNQNVNSVYSSNNQTKTESSRSQRADRVLTVPDTAGAAEAYGFGFNSWITDGVRLDIDTQTTTAFLCTCILINGADVSNVHVGSHDDLGTGTSAVDINTVGFEPDLVMVTQTFNPTALPDENPHALISFGVGINDGSDTQRCLSISSKDNVTSASVVTASVHNDSIIAQAWDGALAWKGVIGSYDSSGFSITPSASANSTIPLYLCLKFTNSPDLSLFDMTIPTSGNYAETTPGFEPVFGLMGITQGPTARNTVAASGTELGGMSIAAFNSTDINTITATEDDNVSTTYSRNTNSDSFRVIGVGSEVVTAEGTYAFDSDGWDFTLTTNPSAAMLGWGLAIGAGAAAATAKPLGHQRLDNQVSPIAASRLNGVLQ